MLKINAPPEVLVEREKTNRALAREGWGPTLRLKLLRTPVAASVLCSGSLGALWMMFHSFFR